MCPKTLSVYRVGLEGNHVAGLGTRVFQEWSLLYPFRALDVIDMVQTHPFEVRSSGSGDGVQESSRTCVH